MQANENTGDRPSLFELARRATGESIGPVPQAYRKALEHSKACQPPLDLDHLRALASDVPTPDPLLSTQGTSPHALPAPANRPPVPWLQLLAPGLALVAAALFFVTPDGPTEPVYTGIKGGDAQLSWAVESRGEILHGTKDLLLGPGERLQLQIYPGQASQLALVSIDSSGSLSWIAPESESEGTVSLEPGRTWLVPGAFRLDAAPGPEVFVAGVGPKAQALAARVRQAQAEGLEVLEALAEDPELDVLVVSKAEGSPAPRLAPE